MRNLYNLNEGWLFELLESPVDESQYLINKESEKVNLPHSWNSDGDFTRGLGVYQTNLKVEENHKDKELFLEFLGANSICRVYLNGHFVGEHKGGYSVFRFPITKFCLWGEENLLTVYVDNSATQDVSPLFGDFAIYGGLYRDVNLIYVDKNHFDLEYWGTNGVLIRSDINENGQGEIDLELHPVTEENLQVRIQVCSFNDEVAKEIIYPATKGNYKIIIENPRLWRGKKDPVLYKLKAYLESKDKIYDYVENTFGFRKVICTSDKGIFLNDEHIRINGVSKHQDFEGKGNAITLADMERDIHIIREVGANAVRLSHYQHHYYTYDLCDSEGLIVWAEIPMMAMPQEPGVLENAESQLRELILQNMHHPSICFWGIQNEIAMQGESIAMYRGVERLNALAHELLPNCITTSANMYHVKNSSQLNFITDIQGYNLYYGWYYGKEEDLGEWMDKFHEENPQVALGISEYGADCNLAFHSDNPKVKDYSEEFQSLYHEKTYGAILSKSYTWGSFLWNMFDFGSAIRNEGGSVGRNNKGLVTFDRKIKKDAFYFYKAQWSNEEFVHICEKRFVNRHKDSMEVKVYSNLSEVSLYINGKYFATAKGENVFKFKDVPLREQKNIIEVFGGDKKDSAIFFKVEEEDKSYIFIDKNPGINVENWFKQEKGEIDLFPEGYYSVMDKIGDLMENEEAWTIINEMAPMLTERASKGSPVTLIWVANKLSSVVKEEDIKKLNEKLIKIKK